MNAPQMNPQPAQANFAVAQQPAGDTELQRLMQRAYSPREDLLSDKFDRMMRLAELMAKSGAAVPVYLRDNVGACFAVVQQAMRWNADPWAVALKTHVVNDMVAYESQLIGAVLNASGAIQEAALQDEYFGDWSKVIGHFIERESKYQNKDGSAKTYRKLATTLEDEKGVGIRVWATLAGEANPRVLSLLLSQASVRNSTLWADDPQQQLFYLAQKRWARKYAPGVILGLYSADELPGADDVDLDTGEIAAPPPKPGPQRRSAAAPAATPAPTAAPTPGPAATKAPAATQAPTQAPTQQQAASTGGHSERISGGQANYLRQKIKAAHQTPVAATDAEAAACKRFGVASLEDFNLDAFDLLKSELLSKT